MCVSKACMAGVLVLAVAVVAAGVRGTAKGVLSDAEMEALHGKVGDGCPCTDASNKAVCSDADVEPWCTDGYADITPQMQITLNICYSYSPKVDWRGADFNRCKSTTQNDKTCNDQPAEWCSKIYPCQQSQMFWGYKWDPVAKECSLPDENYSCRKCVWSTSPTVSYVTPQTCSGEE